MNPKLRELLAKRDAALVKMQALADKAEAESRALSAEENTSFAAIKTELDGLDSRIETLRTLADLKRDTAADEQETAIAADADERKRIELKAPEKFRSLGEQLQAIAMAENSHGRSIDNRLIVIDANEQRASGASMTIPQDGGFLVQQDFTTALLDAGNAEAVIYPQTMKLPVSGSGIDAPFIDESSRADGSRAGGVQIYRNHEAESVTASKPKFGNLKMDLEDLTALAYASDNLLEDAPLMGAIFSQVFAAEYAFKLDDEIINGTGSGEMLGVLASNALVEVAKETGQAATTVVYENITKMWSRMIARHRAGANWYINQDVEPQLFQMSLSVGTGGAPAYMPPNGLSAQPFATLMGRPVLPLEQCPTLGTVGDVILMNPSRYVVIEKGGIQADVSMHVRFINHEQTFRWKMRNNGQPIQRTVLTPHSGSTNTLSAYVALASRA